MTFFWKFGFKILIWERSPHLLFSERFKLNAEATELQFLATFSFDISFFSFSFFSYFFLVTVKFNWNYYYLWTSCAPRRTTGGLRLLRTGRSAAKPRTWSHCRAHPPEQEFLTTPPGPSALLPEPPPPPPLEPPRPSRLLMTGRGRRRTFCRRVGWKGLGHGCLRITRSSGARRRWLRTWRTPLQYLGW